MLAFGARTSPKTGFDKSRCGGVGKPLSRWHECVPVSEAMVIGMCHKGENVRYSYLCQCRDVCCCASGDVGILEQC